MKKALLSLVMLTALIAFGAAQAEAATGAISVTATITARMEIEVTPADWAIGDVVENESVPLRDIVVTSAGTNNTNVDLNINCSNSHPGNWTLAGVAGPEVFEMKVTGGVFVDGASATALTNEDQVLQTGVIPGTSVGFYLDFQAPTATDDGGEEQTITVTLTSINA